MATLRVCRPLENDPPPERGMLDSKPQLFLTPPLPSPADREVVLAGGSPGQGHQGQGNFCSVVSTERRGCFPPIPQPHIRFLTRPPSPGEAQEFRACLRVRVYGRKSPGEIRA